MLKISQKNPDDTDQPEEQEQEEQKIFNIPDYKIAWLNHKIEGLNRVAKKLGTDEIGYKVLEEFTRDDPTDESGFRKILFKKIELFGESPIIKTESGESYQFISRIMHTEEGNILKNVPGEELPVEFRKIPPRCQHCNYDRRRKDTFVLRNNDTKQYMQVGSTCLKDFLGHPNANRYASWAETLADLRIELEASEKEEGFGGAGRSEYAYEVESFLQMVYACIKAYGWMGRGRAHETMKPATVDSAIGLMNSKTEDDKKERARVMSLLTGEDKEMLKGALEWARALKDGTDQEVNQLNDYLWNLSIAASQPAVLTRSMGILASLPVAYNKAVLSQIVPDSRTVVGDKGDTIVGQGIIEDEAVHSDSTVYRIKTNDNKLVQWSGDPMTQQIGERIIFEGVVIGYSRFFNSVVTRLAGIKILDKDQYQQRKDEISKQTDIQQPAPEYQVGERFTTSVVILSAKEFEGAYGPTTIYKMVDNWKNILTWFASGRGQDFVVGEKLNITATVKKIGEYQGKPEINITRAKVNGRELPEGVEDERLSPADLKAVKKREKEINKAVKNIDDQSGIGSDVEKSGQMSEVMKPLQRFWGDFSNTFYQLKIYPQEMILNYRNINSILDQVIVAAQQSIQANQQELEKIKQNPEEKGWRIESLESTTGRQIESLNRFQQDREQLVSEFVKKAEEFVPRLQMHENNKPAREQLLNELYELNRSLGGHKQMVKEYGPRTASSSWFQKLSKIMIAT